MRITATDRRLIDGFQGDAVSQYKPIKLIPFSAGKDLSGLVFQTLLTPDTNTKEFRETLAEKGVKDIRFNCFSTLPDGHRPHYFMYHLDHQLGLVGENVLHLIHQFQAQMEQLGLDINPLKYLAIDIHKMLGLAIPEVVTE